MTTTNATVLTRRLEAEARRLGFEAVGATRLRPSDHDTFLGSWLERGYHGTMGYLARTEAVAARCDPESRWPELRSALVVAHHYGHAGDGESNRERGGSSAGTDPGR